MTEAPWLPFAGESETRHGRRGNSRISPVEDGLWSSKGNERYGYNEEGGDDAELNGEGV